MNVLVATTQSPYVWGGAEALAAGLVDALRSLGHRAEQLLVPFFPRPLEHVVQSMQMTRAIEIGETNFGPIDRLITLMFPAYLIEHPHKALWLVHQYRQFYELWDEPGMGFASLPFGEPLREAVTRADRLYLPRHRRLFTISGTVARRLQESTGLRAETLYPPLADASGYGCEDAGDYFLFPGRVSVLKRQDLVLQSLARTRSPVRVRFIGGVDDDVSLDRFISQAAALGVAERIEYLGWVSETEKRTLYARSIGVLFPPRLEDLGLVTQEAMHSSKPIVTCHDSAGALEFVSDRENGLVTDPDPAAFADALDLLWNDRVLSARLGEQGLERVRAMALSWPRVVERLLA